MATRVAAIKEFRSDNFYLENKEDHDAISNECLGDKAQEGWGWKDSSATKSSGCSCKGPGLGSQYPHGISQLPVTPDSGHLTPSSDFCGFLHTLSIHKLTQMHITIKR